MANQSVALPESGPDFTLEVESAITAEASSTHLVEESKSARLSTLTFSYRYGKRMVDLTVAIVGLLLFSPLFLAIAVAVKLSSPGSVFYREWRVGRYGRLFTIFKFRSMYTKEHLREVFGYTDCEQIEMRKRWDEKHAGDRRITKIGTILRKTSLDELPQLFNVLLGDMSLVGPRPVVQSELQRYGRYGDFYKLFYPGMTGLWQVSGRNDISYYRRVMIDVEYCASWSFMRDASILIRTLPAVMKGKGAY